MRAYSDRGEMQQSAKIGPPFGVAAGSAPDIVARLVRGIKPGHHLAPCRHTSSGNPGGSMAHIQALNMGGKRLRGFDFVILRDGLIAHNEVYTVEV